MKAVAGRHQAAGRELNPDWVLRSGVASRERSRAAMRAEQRGYQLAQLRKNTGADPGSGRGRDGRIAGTGVADRARKVTEVDAIRGYVEALGGTVDVVARVRLDSQGRLSAEPSVSLSLTLRTVQHMQIQSLSWKCPMVLDSASRALPRRRMATASPARQDLARGSQWTRVPLRVPGPGVITRLDLETVLDHLAGVSVFPDEDFCRIRPR